MQFCSIYPFLSILCKRGWGHTNFVLLRTTCWYAAMGQHVGPFRRKSRKQTHSWISRCISKQWVEKSTQNFFRKTLFFPCISNRENLSALFHSSSPTFNLVLELATTTIVPALQQTMSLPVWILTSRPIQVFYRLLATCKNLLWLSQHHGAWIVLHTLMLLVPGSPC